MGIHDGRFFSDNIPNIKRLFTVETGGDENRRIFHESGHRWAGDDSVAQTGGGNGRIWGSSQTAILSTAQCVGDVSAMLNIWLFGDEARRMPVRLRVSFVSRNSWILPLRRSPGTGASSDDRSGMGHPGEAA